MKKFGAIAVLVLVIAGVGGVVFLLSNLNSIVEKIIEDEGTEVVQTNVSASGVEISLREGRGTIAGISIDSPDGYTVQQAFTLEEITVDLDLDRVREDPIVIEEIRVMAPAVHAELLQTGASNIAALNENVQRFVASTGGGGAEQQPADLKKIRIMRFVFEEGQISVDASALDLGKRELNLPSIHLDDIGGPAGSPPDAIAQAVMKALTRKASQAIAQAEIENQVKDLVTDQVKEKAGGLLDKVTK